MWDEIIGHQKQIEQLKSSLATGKLHHAWLFSGIEGIGKKRVALGLAQALHGQSEKVVRGIHPDCTWIEVEPDGKAIKIESLRKLKQKIFLHPMEGNAKTVLIFDAHAMTEGFANALLKILEEPPPNTYFLLITSQATKLLPTIRSRCQQIEFSPLNLAQIEGYLKEAGHTPIDAQTRASYAQGSLKAALDFDAKKLGEIQNQIASIQKNPAPAKIFELCEEWLKEEEALPSLFATLSHLWHEKILNEKENESFELKNYLRQWQAIQQATKDLETNANKDLLLENLLFSLAQ